jgi:hypothetical protein
MGEASSAEIDQEPLAQVVKAPELVSDPDYLRFVHAAGDIPEIVQRICDEGFACEGDLLSTTVLLPPKDEMLKSQAEQETIIDEWWLDPKYQAKFDADEPRIP